MTFHADEITKKTLMGSIVKTSFVSLNYIKIMKETKDCFSFAVTYQSE